MRDLKFRAFNKAEQKMCRVVSSDFTDMVTVRFPEFEGNEFSGDYNDVMELNEFEPLMQYTGLKDKNGREIYEGDILRVWQEDEYVPNRDSGGGIIDYDCDGGFSQIGKVGFTGCSFDYSTVKTLSGKHEEIHVPIDWINNYEVIGNIYENPELLEETK